MTGACEEHMPRIGYLHMFAQLLFTGSLIGAVVAPELALLWVIGSGFGCWMVGKESTSAY